VSCVLTRTRFFATASTTLPASKQPEPRRGLGPNSLNQPEA